MLSGLVTDFTVALRVKHQQAPLSTQMYLPGLHPGQTLPNFFSALAHQIESLFLTGKAPYPVERTLLTTGILAAAVQLAGSGSKASRHASSPESGLPAAPAIDLHAELGS